MGKIIKRVIAILLCVTAVILLLIPSPVVEASIERGDYLLDGSVLEKYNGREPDITIPMGVTKIGKEAFANNNYIRSVYIPTGITSIDFSAFENCKNLEKVIIGEDVTSIGQSAFSGCQSLKTINIPRYVENIGSGAFAACPSLSTVNVDDKNRHFLCLDGVIYTKDGNKMVQYLAGRPYSTYDIPAPVTEIGEFGFFGANMLTNVSIASGVKEIPEYTFLNCNALNNVTIPKTVEAIRKGAFGGCKSLTKLAIPAEVRYIDINAFTSLNGEKGDVVEANSGVVLSSSSDENSQNNEATLVSDANTNEQADINQNNEEPIANTNEQPLQDQNTEENDNSAADDANSVANDADSNLVDLIKNAVENAANDELSSTTIVGGQAVFMMNPKDFVVRSFDMNEAQNEDTIADSVNQTPDGNTVRSFSGREFDVIDGVLGHYGGKDSNISIPDEVTKLGNRVFYKNRDINEINLPANINEVGDFAFARSSVKKVHLPDGTKKIGYAAFYNCKNLSDLSIPDSVDTIELGALDGTKYLDDFNEIEDGNDFLIVGDGILMAYKGFGNNVVIPNNVKKIGPGVFEGNTRVKSVEFPETVTDICEDAFNGCIGLTDVKLPSYLKNIEDRAFKDTSLSHVTIPSYVENIGLGAFDTTGANGGLEYVTFNAASFPNVSYKPTASRLSAHDLRTNAFEGTPYAFVIGESNIDSGNIFDVHEYGFRGEVLTKDIESDTKPYYELRRVLKEPDSNGIVTVEDNVTVDGTNYLLSGVRESAFKDYKNTEWCKNVVNGINVNGNNSDALNNLISSLDIGKETVKDTDLRINIDDSLNINKSKVKAVIPDLSGEYILNVSKDNSSDDAMKKAFDNRYGHSDNVFMNNLSFDLSEKLSAIPIHKMADSKMDIEIPVPEEMKENENLYIASLDDNGLLENIPSEIVKDEEGLNDTIKFVASHLSPYCIYYFTDEGSMILADSENDNTSDNNDVTLSTEIVVNKDALSSPNTETLVVKSLNKSIGTIKAKYIIAFILFAVAALLFTLSLNNKRISKHN